MRFLSFSITAVCMAISIGGVRAADKPQRDFGFSAMEIYKINKGTRLLKSEDLDRDGRDDIVFLNNSKSRLEILFRKDKKNTDGTELLDDLFDNSGMMVDQQVSTYVLSDLNNDQKTDIITMGTPLGLHIRWQKDSREFSAPVHIFLNKLSEVMTVQAGDINEDGLADIVVSRRGGAEILWNDAKQTFTKRKNIPYADDKCFWLELIDADKDGHLDLLQYYRDKDIPLKVRLGNGRGEFGPSHMLRIPHMKTITLVKPQYNNPLMLAGVLSNALGMRLYEFEKTEQPVLTQTQEFTPQRMALPKKGGISELPWLAADFDSDGYDDFMVSAPTMNRLYLYKGCPAGLESSAVKYDTLAEVSGLSLLEGGDILAVSKKEKAVAIHRRKNMDDFPELLDLKGELITAAAVSGTKSIYVIRRADEKIVLDYYEDTKFKKSWPLELDNAPSVIKPFSMGDSRTGIILFIDYDLPQMIVIGKDGIEKIDASKFRALSQNLKPYQVMEPVPGSGKELVVSAGTTVRSYQWRDGAYNITGQYNPMNERAKADLAAVCDYTDGKGLMVYDSSSKDLLWYRSDGSKEPQKIHINTSDGSFNGMVQLKNKNQSILALIGSKDMALLSSKGLMLALKSVGEYMSVSEKPSLRIVRNIEIGKPRRPALAIVDAANRAVEIVSKQNDEIKNELTFAAFLKSDMVGPAASRATEPHDITSGDINGDGYDDMILLVHENLLIYPGE